MAGMEGRRLGAYELVGRIGGGGMAEVYRARQLTAFGREVAIKVIRAGFSEDPTFRERFLREAQAISRLSHPHILPLIEFGEEAETLYLVLPLAREGTLRELLQQQPGPLALEAVVPLFSQLCDAVQYAHDEGIIHRDLKPQNVLLQRRTHVLLADFGIARDTAEAQHMTTTGAGIGTVEYMAPEQAMGQATKLSDLYSLGIVLYQLVTGRVPYTGSTPFQVLTRHVRDPLPDPRLLNPGLPAELVEVLQHALAKAPEQRFQSALALGRAVQQARPDALGDLPTRTSATQPPRSSAPWPQGTLSTRPTRPGQHGREQPFAPGSPDEAPGGPTPSRAGGITRELPDRWEAPLPPGWARGEAEGAGDDRPTWSTRGGRTVATAPGWQQGGRSGPPPVRGAGPVPQPPASRRRRGVLLGALVAAVLLLLLLASVGAANALGLFTGPSGSQVALGPTATSAAQAAGTSSAPVPTTGTGVSTTDTAGPTATSSLPTRTSPSPTRTSSPTVTPSPTPDPFPNIQGAYMGTYLPAGNSYVIPLEFQIAQSGNNLSGTSCDNGHRYTISGTIDTSGNITIYEAASSGTVTFSGSIVSPGHLSGNYSAPGGGTGFWNVTPQTQSQSCS